MHTPLNLAARFLPIDPEDESTLPCLEVAGVQVYAYVEAGRMCVSVHLDTADPALALADGTVPLTITVNDTTIFESRERIEAEYRAEAADALNDQVQQSRSREECWELLHQNSAPLVRAVADLNHVDDTGHPDTVRRRILDDRWPVLLPQWEVTLRHSISTTVPVHAATPEAAADIVDRRDFPLPAREEWTGHKDWSLTVVDEAGEEVLERIR